MLDQILAERDLLPLLVMNDGRPVTPALWPERRAELLHALQTHSYGFTPPAPERVVGEIVSKNPLYCAGKVLEQRLRITFDTPSGDFTFPLALFVPQWVEKPPVFLHIAFRPDLPDRYVPIEEITDAGFALAVFCYKDIVNDNLHGDFSDGLARAFHVDKDRDATTWGKIGMWAYAASRALDYLLTRDDIDAQRTAVIGHSRLGKTALWAAAQDERFWCGISNNSGYGGAASSKHGEGERVRDFLRCGSWDWYCENFKLYVDELEDCKPYDQSQLLALIAPRLLCVGSAVLDAGADPKAEFLTSLYASQAWDLLGAPGLIAPDRMPVPGDHFAEGRIGYHLRNHRHYLSREDWNHYIRFLQG